MKVSYLLARVWIRLNFYLSLLLDNGTVSSTLNHNDQLYRQYPHTYCQENNKNHQESKNRETIMAPTLCGGAIASRRGLLASLWSLVTILTAFAFLTAFVFAISSKQQNSDDYNYRNEEGNSEDDNDPEIAVTSRALAFSALWTAVLSALMAVFGTVILGWQSPTGRYYTCCSSNVHRTTPLGLGSFIGALLMFANLTLICSVLFGEFEVRLSRICFNRFALHAKNLTKRFW